MPRRPKAAGDRVDARRKTRSRFPAVSDRSAAYARGVEQLTGTFGYLDVAPFGRNEDAQEPGAWWHRHDEYQTGGAGASLTEHRIGTQEEWQAQRDALLKEEKEFTRRNDELARKRRAPRENDADDGEDELAVAARHAVVGRR